MELQLPVAPIRAGKGGARLSPIAKSRHRQRTNSLNLSRKIHVFTSLFGKRGRGSSIRRKHSTAFLSNVRQLLICLVPLLEQSRDSKHGHRLPRWSEPGKEGVGRPAGRAQTGPGQVARGPVRKVYVIVG